MALERGSSISDDGGRWISHQVPAKGNSLQSSSQSRHSVPTGTVSVPTSVSNLSAFPSTYNLTQEVSLLRESAASTMEQLMAGLYAPAGTPGSSSDSSTSPFSHHSQAASTFSSPDGRHTNHHLSLLSSSKLSAGESSPSSQKFDSPPLSTAMSSSRETSAANALTSLATAPRRPSYGLEGDGASRPPSYATTTTYASSPQSATLMAPVPISSNPVTYISASAADAFQAFSSLGYPFPIIPATVPLSSAMAASSSTSSASASTLASTSNQMTLPAHTLAFSYPSTQASSYPSPYHHSYLYPYPNPHPILSVPSTYAAYSLANRHRSHSNSLTPGKEAPRPYKCDECGQSFQRNHDLKRHKKIHLEVKPYPCGYCDRAFSRRDALKRHWLVKGCPDKAQAAAAKEAEKAGSQSPPSSTKPGKDGSAEVTSNNGSEGGGNDASMSEGGDSADAQAHVDSDSPKGAGGVDAMGSATDEQMSAGDFASPGLEKSSSHSSPLSPSFPAPAPDSDAFPSPTHPAFAPNPANPTGQYSWYGSQAGGSAGHDMSPGFFPPRPPFLHSHSTSSVGTLDSLLSTESAVSSQTSHSTHRRNHHQHSVSSPTAAAFGAMQYFPYSSSPGTKGQGSSPGNRPLSPAEGK